MMKLELALPFTFMMLVLLVIAYLNYGVTKTGWFLVIYPDEKVDAFAAVSHHVEAISNDYPKKNSAIVYIASPSQRDGLSKSGAYLLATDGAPICVE